jgi:DNA repair exonuclease SbcCD ATPase subunit
MNYSSYLSAYNKALGKREVLTEQKKEQTANKVRLEDRALAIEQAQVIIQKVAQRTQEQLRFHIEDIVNTAIDTVFPGVYKFALEFEIKRNKTEGNLKFTKDGREMDILNSNGGGLCDTAALGLRIAAWSLGNSNSVLVLDESLKFLSRELQPRMGEVLKEIGDKLGLQIILVSHQEPLLEFADKVFLVKQKDKVSTVDAV